MHDVARMREEALMKATFVALVIAVASLVGLSAVGASEGDREAVRQAALDYVDGIYEVMPDRIQRATGAESPRSLRRRPEWIHRA